MLEKEGLGNQPVLDAFIITKGKLDYIIKEEVAITALRHWGMVCLWPCS